MSTAIHHECTDRFDGLRGAVASEWIKLWTVRSSWLNIVAAAVLTVCSGCSIGF